MQFLAASMSDKGRIVAVNADNCPLCAHTMRIFTAAYGAEAGVAGLKWLPYGGNGTLRDFCLLEFCCSFCLMQCSVLMFC